MFSAHIITKYNVQTDLLFAALSQFVGVLSYRMERHEQDVSAILRTFVSIVITLYIGSHRPITILNIHFGQ